MAATAYLFNDLDVVVDKAYRAVSQRQSEPREHEGRTALSLKLEDGDVGGRVEEEHTRRCDDGDPDNKHNSAHCRSALLALVPRGTFLEDSLTEIYPVQKRHEEFSDYRRDGEGADCGHKGPDWECHITSPLILSFYLFRKAEDHFH